MGHICSAVRRIDSTRFNRCDLSKGISGVDRITTSRGGAIYIRTLQGTVYTTSRAAGAYAYTGSCHDEVNALLGLGVVTRQEARAHFQHQDAVNHWRDVNDRVTRLEKITAEFEFPAAIRKAMAAAFQRRRDEAEVACTVARGVCKRCNEIRATADQIEAGLPGVLSPKPKKKVGGPKGFVVRLKK